MILRSENQTIREINETENRITVGWQQATALLTQTRIADLDIRATPHQRLNSIQGVISYPDLMNATETDLWRACIIRA